MKKIIVLILFFNFSNVFAADFTSNFTKEEFQQAQKDGKTVVVYSWNKFCGTCAKQKPILKQAKQEIFYAKLNNPIYGPLFMKAMKEMAN